MNPDSVHDRAVLAEILEFKLLLSSVSFSSQTTQVEVTSTNTAVIHNEVTSIGSTTDPNYWRRQWERCVVNC